MTEDSKFKKISVNAAPEEDVVIYAGNSENNVDLSAQADVSVESENATTDVSDEQFCETQNVDDAVLVEHQSSANKSKHNDYHETTLEDIEASKMSSMQKAVIIVAVIAVVAFLIWFLG
jgi:cobalamin biosynthesis Mg chelatase CobN